MRPLILNVFYAQPIPSFLTAPQAGSCCKLEGQGGEVQKLSKESFS